MDEESVATSPSLARLERALASWVDRGNPEPLERWLDREVDYQGLPRALEPSRVWPILSQLAEAAQQRAEDWPESLDARIEGLAWFALNLLRSDGSALFGGDEPSSQIGETLRFWAERLADPRLELAAKGQARAFRRPRRLPSMSWLNSFASDRGPLAILRSSRSDETDPGTDLLAIDQLSRPNHCRMELIGRGFSWLGPSWESGEPGTPIGRARRLFWLSGTRADLLEWSFRIGSNRVIRTAVLLHRERLALLADEWQGPVVEARTRIGLAPDVQATQDPKGRGLILKGPGGLAKVWPLGLPWRENPTEQGELSVQGDQLEMRLAMSNRNCWLPLVVSWDPIKDRRPVIWRPLTISEQSKVCPPSVAFAARLGWGAGREGLVFYRSFAKAARRLFLGYQTEARLLVGRFTTEGEVVPLVQVH